MEKIIFSQSDVCVPTPQQHADDHLLALLQGRMAWVVSQLPPYAMSMSQQTHNRLEYDKSVFSLDYKMNKWLL